jgi:4-amino-4-deoxy-L-arabinose transferase-like glycosyltransferase
VAAVCVLYWIVLRRHGARTGLVAGLLLALSPINVAADRSNLTDSLLVLVLLLGAWALVVAAETGRRRILLFAFALVGVAFNVKMLAAYVVVPAFAATYLAAAPIRWQRQFVDVLLAGTVALAVSLPWLLWVEYTPASERPYVGSSARNSALDLVVGYNGLGRFGGRERGAGAQRGGTSRAGNAAATAATSDARVRNRIARLFVRAPAGALRLADGQLAAQALWLLPLALVAPAAAFVRRRGSSHMPGRVTVVLWSAWLIVYAVVYSFATGIFHFYYLTALAPAIAALAAIGLATAWAEYRQGGRRGAMLPLVLIATGAWQAFVQAGALEGGDGTPAWTQQLAWGVAAGALGAASLLGIARVIAQPHAARTARAGGIGLGALALLVLPVIWSLSSVVIAANGTIPSADLLRLDGSAPPSTAGRERFVASLVAFLRANQHGERFLLATSTYQLAAPIIIATGAPVMARGGFHGVDPALTAETLAQRVAAGEVRFATLGDVSAISRRIGAGQIDVVDWIRAQGAPVDPALWRAGAPRTIELYDLRGSPALVRGDTNPLVR